MKNNECDIVHPNGVKEKRIDIVDGFTIKYHANKDTIWSKGMMVEGEPDGYWEWYRVDGTLKRSGYFKKGEAVGDWSTYDNDGILYKKTNRDLVKSKR
jgi:antitoxin component YwqK of YwqJK toxin-antitoxin module